MPFIKPETYAHIAQQVNKANIVVPRHNGKNGNPIGFGRKFYESLTHLRGDQGGRSVILDNSDAVTYLDTTDPAIFFDIDTPQDLTLFDAQSH
jgi:molybdenum cofactor cytidylyltransferase